MAQFKDNLEKAKERQKGLNIPASEANPDPGVGENKHADQGKLQQGFDAQYRERGGRQGNRAATSDRK